MSGLFSILKQALTIKNDEKMRVGLSQFKLNALGEAEAVTTEPISIRNKSVKLSDLMRKTSSY